MKIFTFLCLLILSTFVQADYLWIESESPDDARVFFGEFNEGVIDAVRHRSTYSFVR